MSKLWRHILWVIPIVLVASIVWPVGSTSQPTEAERFERGLQQLMDGQIDAAAAELAAMSNDHAWLSHRRLLHGGIALRSGNPADAVSQLTAVEPIQELERPTLLLLGEALYRVGDHAHAELCFRELLDHDPDDVDARRWLAAIYYDLGTIQASMRQMEHVIRLAPDDYRPHHLLGVIYLDIEDVSPAQREFRAALERNPPPEVRDEVTVLLARSQTEVGDFEGAQRTLEAVSHRRNDPQVAMIRAQCAYADGDRDRAIDVIRQVLSRDSGNVDALRLSARIEHDQQQWPAAINTLERLLKIAPEDHEARYLLATAYAGSGDRAESARQLELHKRYIDLKAQASDLYAEADGNPTDPDIRDQLADICAELGKPELAAMWRRAADTLRNRQALKGNPPGPSPPSPQ